MMNKYRSKFTAKLWRSALLLAVALSTPSLRAQADGGGVTLHQAAGPFVVTVFTAPGTPRAGPVEVSVLAQDRMDGQATLDIEVFVRLRSAGGTVVMGRATREMSRNKLLYSALVNLLEAGLWELEVIIKRGMSEAGVFGQLYVAAPRPFLLSYWRSLSLPWVVVILFAMNQWLKGRVASRGKKRLTGVRASRLLARRTLLQTEFVDDLTRRRRIAHAHDSLSNRRASVWRNGLSKSAEESSPSFFLLRVHQSACLNNEFSA
jgi:hypothetical protein